MRFFVLVLLFTVSSAFADGKIRNTPPCLDNNRNSLSNSNSQVLQWKESSPNQYKARALVSGTIVSTTLDRSSHLHIEIDLTPETPARGNDTKEHLEVVYNKKFGAIPAYEKGMQVFACGDYITAREQAGNFPPSPMGAIIHWVHMSPNPERHPSGYLMIDGVVHGQVNPDALKAPKAPKSFFPEFAF